LTTTARTECWRKMSVKDRIGALLDVD